MFVSRSTKLVERVFSFFQKTKGLIVLQLWRSTIRGFLQPLTLLQSCAKVWEVPSWKRASTTTTRTWPSNSEKSPDSSPPAPRKSTKSTIRWIWICPKGICNLRELGSLAKAARGKSKGTFSLSRWVALTIIEALARNWAGDLTPWITHSKSSWRRWKHKACLNLWSWSLILTLAGPWLQIVVLGLIMPGLETTSLLVEVLKEARSLIHFQSLCFLEQSKMLVVDVWFQSIPLKISCCR